MGNMSELFLNKPLRIKEVTLDLLVVVRFADVAISSGLRPQPPSLTFPIGYSPEPCVVLNIGICFDKGRELIFPFGTALGEKRFGQRFDNSPFRAHHFPVIYKRRLVGAADDGGTSGVGN